MSSREATPEPILADVVPPSQTTADGLLSYSCDEIVRLLGIYQEEIACVHPIVETRDLVHNAPQVLEFAKHPDRLSTKSRLIGSKDVHMVKIAIATALIHETHGKNEVSDKLIHSVELDVGVISLASEVELKDIQIMGMLVGSSQYSLDLLN